MLGQAEHEAIAVLVSYMKRTRITESYGCDKDGYRVGPNGEYVGSEDSPAANEAREVCHTLLRAANANGLCGCRLCQS